jgi:O-acetyl-ADP-ribose deacetylase (regulator of RNase III)
MSFKLTVAPGQFDAAQAKVLSGNNMVPRGSSVITTSGNLAAKGIVAIMHAATGSMTARGWGYDEPTLDSVQQSIENGFALLTANGYNKMAVPFVGGGVFLNRIGCTKPELVDRIVLSCLTKYAAETVMVVYQDPHLMKLFQSSIAAQFPKVDASTVLVDAGITSFHGHHCPVIMNAANMEVQFGGRLSLAIAQATGHETQINQEALADIQAFWKSVNLTSPD